MCFAKKNEGKGVLIRYLFKWYVDIMFICIYIYTYKWVKNQGPTNMATVSVATSIYDFVNIKTRETVNIDDRDAFLKVGTDLISVSLPQHFVHFVLETSHVFSVEDGRHHAGHHALGQPSN